MTKGARRRKPDRNEAAFERPYTRLRAQPHPRRGPSSGNRPEPCLLTAVLFCRRALFWRELQAALRVMDGGHSFSGTTFHADLPALSGCTF